jgi:hypothetical protein
MREFWVSSGHHLTGRTKGGGLAVTDELLLAYLARPELMPPDDACDAERRLHASLLKDPRRAVSPNDIAALADADARENWTLMLGFRDRLLAAPTVEAAYLDLVRRGAGPLPPLFLNQLVHLILRNALEGCTDPYVLRAGELFFRPQRVSFHDGAVLLADDEVIEAHEAGRAKSPLVAMLGQEPAAELDVLDDANAWTYWSRSDAFSMALNIGANPRSREGLARVVETWVRHLLHVEVSVEPVTRIEDPDWRWFVGLDAEATRIGNALWRGDAVDEDAMSRVLALFRLTFAERDRVDPKAAGSPVYLLLAMTPDRIVRVKPQNLVMGLPVTADT